MSRLFRRLTASARPRPRPVSQRARLSLRALEDRTVPVTFTVTNTGDAGLGSGTSGDLRYCITQANTVHDIDQSFPNVVDATGVTGTITLLSPLPAISFGYGMTFNGPGASLLAINANNLGSVFNVTTARQLNVSGLTLTGGRTAGNGGAINGGGSVSLTNSIIRGNTAGGYGGGIYDRFGTIAVQGSTISGNSASQGGGGLDLYYSAMTSTYPPPPSLTVSNSTIANNTAAIGGGILGGYDYYASAQLVNSTVTGDVATAGPGGGIYDQFGDGLSLDNTIVSGNSSASGVPDVSASGFTVSASYSALGTIKVNQFIDGGSNLTATNATPAALKLGPLTDFPVQGVTPARTMPLIPLGVGSTAIGDGDSSQNGVNDERGVSRPQQLGMYAQPDIGAFERFPGPPGAALTTATNLTAAGGTTYTFVVTYTDNNAPIDLTTLGNGNVKVASPAGVPSLSVSYVGNNASNPNSVAATYQFSAPGGAWSGDDDGYYTVVMQAGQVSDSNGPVPTGPIGTFVVGIPRTLTVTNANDDGPGSLRVAITTANGDFPGVDTISFSNSTSGGATNFYDGSAHTITLLTALPTITTAVTIAGPGSSLLAVTRGAGSFLIFDVNAGAQAVMLSGLAVFNGQGGGGIQDTTSPLTLTDMLVAGNTGAGITMSGAGVLNVVKSRILSNSGGGGIYAPAGGTINISDSNISDNVGSAMYIVGGTALSISNCTITRNKAGTVGGIGLIDFTGTARVVASTIVGNTGASSSFGAGIALEYGSGSVTLDSTIVSGNLAGNGDISVGGGGGYVSSDFSAIGVEFGLSSSYSRGLHDLPLGAALNLQPLANNGGPTQTIALGSGSPAIDHGDPGTGLTTDQRGYARPSGPAPDIGAFEVQLPTVANIQVNDGSAQRSEVRSIAVTFSDPVTFVGGNAAAAFQLTRVQTGNNVVMSATTSTDALGRTVVTFGFSGGETDPISALNGGLPSLADGRYQLTVFGASVIGPDGLALAGNGSSAGSNYVSPTDTLGGGTGQLHLYRLFGDANGDGMVDATDLGQLKSTFNRNNVDPLYLSFLDADNSGVIDAQDIGQFKARFNHTVF